jgi:hypothetical protein
LIGANELEVRADLNDIADPNSPDESPAESDESLAESDSSPRGSAISARENADAWPGVTTVTTPFRPDPDPPPAPCPEGPFPVGEGSDVER